MVPVLSDSQWLTVGVAAVLLAGLLVIVAVATGRGWRSAWWSRRAEVAESVCGSFAIAVPGRRGRLVPHPVGIDILMFRALSAG